MPGKPRYLIKLAPLAVILFGISSCAAPPSRPTGLVDGHLRPCPKSPNCVSSETEAARARIEPLAYSGTVTLAWRDLRQTIEDTGGKIVETSPGYLRAVYTSPVLRFEDDVEFRLNEAAALFEMRSASRLGYWDLGVNRRRLEKIRRLFVDRSEGSGRQQGEL
jgi:uncharacterized protein (DUF1499 family)